MKRIRAKKDRDGNGKFVPGNQAAVGHRHPLAASAFERRVVASTAVSLGELRKLIRRLYKRAIKGDNFAARLVLDRCLGRLPALSPEADPADEGYSPDDRFV